MATLPDARGQQRLAQHVVDLVRAGMAEVLTLEVNAHRAPRLLRDLGRQARPEAQRGGTADVFGEEAPQVFREARVRAGGLPGGRKLVQGRDQGLGDVPATERAEATGAKGD